MPSEERIEVALKALAGPIEKYRSAVVMTAEEVRGYLSANQADEETGDRSIAAGLGVFAAGRIDMDRFADIVSDSQEKRDPDTLKKVEKAFDILRTLSSGGDDAFHLKLKRGVRLRNAVAGRLSEIGLAFAAARVAGLARLGALGNGKVDDLLKPLQFDSWNSGERRLAPPLVIELDGSQLHAADLAEFLDGNVKMVLLVGGESAPAPLVRLITPSTFVLQTSDEKELDRFAAAEAPAIAALMPAAAAAFVHDPAGGDLLQKRLEVTRMPEKPPRKKLGGMSAQQQKEELDQLQALASAQEAGAGAGAAADATAQMTSVDKLASWLLQQTDLSGAE